VPIERVETLIVGGGEAGLAMSEQLSQRDLPHLVVERNRIAERWRSERWKGCTQMVPPGMTGCWAR
jgi:putative flavoprotein involved in K+ transport